MKWDFLALIFAVIVLMIVLVAWRFHVDPQRKDFDLTDLLMENHRLSKISLVMLGAFLVTSWTVIYMVMNKTMTEGFMAIYVGAWIAPIVSRILKGNKPTEAKS